MLQFCVVIRAGIMQFISHLRSHFREQCWLRGGRLLARFVKADFPMDEIREQGKTLADIMMEVMGYDEQRYKALFE